MRGGFTIQVLSFWDQKISISELSSLLSSRQNTSWADRSLAVVSSITIKLKTSSWKIPYYPSSLWWYCPRFFNGEAHIPSEKNLGVILCEWYQRVFHLKPTIKKFDLTVEFQFLSICLINNGCMRFFAMFHHVLLITRDPIITC